jgi:uncharacterized repeat protein (TIGR03803 family)
MARSDAYIPLLLAAGLAAVTPAGATSFKTLYSVTGSNDGAGDQHALIDVGGLLYGTTAAGGAAGNGTVFSFDPTTGAERVIYSFKRGTDGADPASGLTNIGGTLYGTTVQGGAFGNGAVFSLDPASGAERVIYSFKGGADGASPEAALIDVGGTLYGTTAYGGASGVGTVFSISFGGAENVVYSFKAGADGAYPSAALIDVGGTLYGTTDAQGVSGNGTVFGFTPASGAESVIYSFKGGTDGADPEAALIDVGGTLYGTTYEGGASGSGTVFSVNPASGAERVIYSFGAGRDGAFPEAALIDVGGTLYGTTNKGGSSGGGTVFSVNPATGAESVVYSFAGGGATPLAALTDVGGKLYGTTSQEGAFGAGTVFSLDPASGAEAVLHSFSGSFGYSTNALLAVNGRLFLSASAGGAGSIGDIVRITPSTGASEEIYAFARMANGDSPSASLIDVGGRLYGTTVQGGAAATGDVFRLSPASGAENVVYSFKGGSDGAYPEAPLISAGGTLYGTTAYGGVFGSGAVFSVGAASGAERVVHSFTGGKDGSTPLAALINVGGKLYGTASGGGAGAGNVFSIDPASGRESVAYTFKGGTDGADPVSALINVGGTLYGTTPQGGASGSGTVFSLNPATGAQSVIYSFTGGKDGSTPLAALIDFGGKLYGTTFQGGAFGDGAVVSVDPVSRSESVVYSFTGGADGACPDAALVSIGGILYGTTRQGGAGARGTVFQLIP